MSIKVQIYGQTSTNAQINSGIQSDFEKNPLTFIAFSDSMKAKVLEMFVKSSLKIGLSFYHGSPKTGEWHEPSNTNAIFNFK